MFYVFEVKTSFDGVTSTDLVVANTTNPLKQSKNFYFFAQKLELRGAEIESVKVVGLSKLGTKIQVLPLNEPKYNNAMMKHIGVNNINDIQFYEDKIIVEYKAYLTEVQN